MLELRTSRPENSLAPQRALSLTSSSVASAKNAPQVAHAVVVSQDTAATDLGRSVLTASSAATAVKHAAHAPEDDAWLDTTGTRWARTEHPSSTAVSPLPARSAAVAFRGSNVAHQSPTGEFAPVDTPEGSGAVPAGGSQHGLSQNWAVAGNTSAPDATGGLTSRGFVSEHTSHEQTLTEYPAQYPPMLHMSSHDDRGSMLATPPATAMPGALYARQGSFGSEVCPGDFPLLPYF